MPREGPAGRAVRIVITAASVISAGTVAAEPGNGYAFPPDLEGMTAVDRELEWLSGSMADALYAVLYIEGGTGLVVVHAGTYGEDGMEWEVVREWVPAFGDHPVQLEPGTVLFMDVSDGEAVLTYVDDLETYEGRVGIYLWIDLETGESLESWSD